MERSRLRRFKLPTPDGWVEALLEAPRAPRRAAIVLHGGGGRLDDRLVSLTGRALRERGTAVLRFNFRGVGRSSGTFYADDGEGERRDTRAALDFMSARYPGLPLWVAGISFGSWIGFRVALSDRRVKGLLGLALPLRIGRFDLSFLRRKRATPLAVVQGERDGYGPRAQVESFVAGLRDPKRLWIVARASHGFPRKTDGLQRAVRQAVAWLGAPGYRRSSRKG